MSECSRLSKPILIFDSGVGGLTVFEHIHSLLPAQDIYYLFDNARLPYGDLTEEELVKGCVALITKEVARLNAAIVVVACNTASTLVLPALRAHLSIPVVGVVPAIKPAAQISTTKHIALLATPGTVTRSYTQDLIDSFAQDCQVTLIGSSELVLMAEQKAAADEIDIVALESILKPLTDTNIDTLVLGCTHFPLLADEIKHAIKRELHILDSGAAIAARVKTLLGTAEQNENVQMEVGFTKEVSQGLKQMLANYKFKQYWLIS